MAEAAGVAGALGAALLVLASSRAMLLGGMGLVALAMTGLAVDGGQLDAASALLSSPAGVATLALVLAALVAGAALLVRRPLAVLPLLLVAAPLALPIARDPDSPVLLGFAGTGGIGRLYPLFAVLAAAALALVWRTARGTPVPPLPRMIAVPAALLAALASASLLWTVDRPVTVEALLFVWLPFTVLLVVVARADAGPRTPRTLAVVLVGIACAFAAWALVQAATQELLFFNVSLERANQLTPLFRVTAAFQDPNHLGRHLALAMAVVLVAAWLMRIRPWTALATLVLLGAGLLFTWSQSSFVALAVVALAIAAAAGGRMARRAAGGVCVAVAVGGAAVLATGLGGGDAAAVTSDRSTLVTDTAATALAHPVVGVGLGAQPLATRDEQRPGTDPLQSASHTAPLTVAAELGVLGLAAFCALLVGAAAVLGRLARSERALALGLGTVLAVLLVHSLFYGGLLENPIAWGALGLAAGALADARAAGPRAARGAQTALRS